MSFVEKVVIVTGASSGIGEATAKLFAKEKANVVLVGRNTEKLNKVKEDIKKSTGNYPLVIKADVTNDEEARSIVDKTIAHFKKLDVLVNNAGFISVASILDDSYVNKFDNILATNLRSVAVLTHAAVPHLIKTKGNIVNISSVASFVCSSKGVSAYATSKAGLDHLSRCLAVELASDGVRVNSVNPGPVITDIAINNGLTKEQSDAHFKKFAKGTPLQIVSESEEIGNVVIFLASEKAKSVTGSSYVIDCGLSLSPKTE